MPEVFGEAAFFGVFDGHAGTRIARHSAVAILEAILQTEEFQRLQQELQLTTEKLSCQSLPMIVDGGTVSVAPSSEAGERRVSSAVEQASLSKTTIEAKIPVENLTLDKRHIDLIVAGIKAGFLSFDNNMRTSPIFYGENERSGTTAVCALILPSHIFLANLGDSRAVMSRHGSVLVATEDHKPFMPKERERITRAGE
uniref:protein-serine/threonine phosphatase n=1 Tax=Romanomermis culicivorax TaxID=13658 RepID=A0A915JJF6_ROMCU